MKNKTLIFIPILLLIISCSKNDRVFRNNLIPDGKIQLFLTQVEYGEPSKYFKYEIETDNQEVIKKIYNLKPNLNTEKQFRPSTLGIISVNGKTFTTFWLNSDVTLISEFNGLHSIDSNSILQHQDKFSELREFSISIENKEEAFKIKEIFDKNGYYILRNDIFPKLEWEEFDGFTVLKVDNDKITFGNRDEIINTLKKDLQKSIPEFRYTEYERKDKYGFIKLYCNNPISDLPENYEYDVEYKNFDEIKIKILGVDKEELKRVLKDNNLDYNSID